MRCHRYFKNTKSRHDYIDSIKCSSCEETFFAGNHYIKHYQTNHGGLPPEYEDREKYMCDQCPSVFILKQHLRKHIQQVHSKVYKKSKSLNSGNDYIGKSKL